MIFSVFKLMNVKWKLSSFKPNGIPDRVRDDAKSGYITPMVLVIVIVSSIILYSLANLVATQYNLSNRQTAVEQARSIAEAGIDYYKWHLAHDPTDYQDGTGMPGPYLHDYYDPEGTLVGTFQLEITPPAAGSTTVTISSTGWTSDLPDVQQTITITYGQSSLAEYAMLFNAPIYLPPGFTVNGPVHSNGGVRQDGQNTSTVTSAVDEWTCNQKYGECSPPETVPGVWGDGEDSGLWNFPVPPVDFDSINVDYVGMKTEAQSTGLYLPPSGSWGYRLEFKSNGDLDVYTVSGADKFKGGKGNPGCEQLYAKITSESFSQSATQADNLIVFVEDDVWISGTVTSPVTVVAAKFPVESQDTQMWILDNLTYSVKDGSIRLGLISQKDIYVHRDVSDDFYLDGALLAQNGRIMRHDYSLGCAGNPANAVRNSINLYGAIISADESKWNWGTSTGSGFLTGNLSFDVNLQYNPPPYFPTTGTFEVLSTTQ